MAVIMRHAATSRRTRVSSGTLRRIFWAVMFAGHLPALLEALVWADASFSRALLLVGSQTFFALKLLDVPWLRIRGGWRPGVALLVGIVLLHARVIQSSLHHSLDSPVSWQMVVLGTGITTATWARQRQRIDGNPARCVQRLARQRLERLRTALLEQNLPLRFLMLARSCRIDRAPPVVCA